MKGTPTKFKRPSVKRAGPPKGTISADPEIAAIQRSIEGTAETREAGSLFGNLEPSIPNPIHVPFSLYTDASSANALLRMLQEPRDREVEMTFGRFVGENFIPSVSGVAVEAMLKNVKAGFLSTIGSGDEALEVKADEDLFPYHSSIQLGAGGKRIVTTFFKDTDQEAAKRRETKHRDKNTAISNRTWGYRVYSSIEAPSDFHEEDGGFERINIRDKWTWVFYVGSFQIHLSAVTLIKETGSPTILPVIGYELEVERDLSSARVEQLQKIVEYCLVALNGGFHNFPSIPEKQDTIRRISDLVRLPSHSGGDRRQDPSRIPSGWWDKPVDLSRQAMLSFGVLQNYCVGVKYDGMRRFLYFDVNGIFAIYPPFECFKILPPVAPLLNGTLIDGELFQNIGTDALDFYAFDILWLKGEDVRRVDFVSRLGIIEREITSHPDLSFIKKKEFFTEGDLYELVRKALTAPLPPGVSSDGLIFAPMGEYRKGRTYKWKSPEFGTIDFFTSPATAHQYNKLARKVERGVLEPEFSADGVMVVQLFLLQDSDPSQKGGRYLLIKDGYAIVNDMFLTNRIVECIGTPIKRGGRLAIHYKPFRVRYDKHHPNTVSHASQMKRSILHPITQSTVEGTSQDLLIKCLTTIKLQSISSIVEKIRGDGKTPVRVLDVLPSSKFVHKLSKAKVKLDNGDYPEWIFVESDPDKHQTINHRVMTDKLSASVVDEISDVTAKISCANIFLSGSGYFVSSREEFDKLMSVVDNTLEVGGKVCWTIGDPNLVDIRSPHTSVSITDLGNPRWPSSVVSFGGTVMTVIPHQFLVEEMADRGYVRSSEVDIATGFAPSFGGAWHLPKQQLPFFNSLKQIIFTKEAKQPVIKMTPQFIANLDLNRVPFGQVVQIHLPNTSEDQPLWMIGTGSGQSSFLMAASLAYIAKIRTWGRDEQEKYIINLRTKLANSITPQNLATHVGEGVDLGEYKARILDPQKIFESNTDAWLMGLAINCDIDVIYGDLSLTHGNLIKLRKIVIWRVNELEYYPLSSSPDSFVLNRDEVSNIQQMFEMAKYEVPEKIIETPIRKGLEKENKVFLLIYKRQRKQIIDGVYNSREAAEKRVEELEGISKVQITKYKVGKPRSSVEK